MRRQSITSDSAYKSRILYCGIKPCSFVFNFLIINTTSYFYQRVFITYYKYNIFAINIQSSKCSAFPFFHALSCPHSSFTVRSLALSAPLRLRSPFTKRSLIVQSVLFIFNWNSKVKGSVFASHNKNRRECVPKGERNIFYINKFILIRIQSIEFEVHILEQVSFFFFFND